jgi:hypothetical protein
VEHQQQAERDKHMTEYQVPSAGGDKLPLADLLGSLLRIDVLEALSNVQTSFGASDPVRAHVVALDGDRKGERFDDSLVFPRVLCSQLRPSVGKVVLGRLGKGVAKVGQSAPWQLLAPNEDDFGTAKRYDAHVAKSAPVAAASDEPF